ncbi:MAG: hypothetical protein K1X88_19845, partial [Nannocystaceae bacterium]|nr:hypothetical protein [Nannocystaceae bacterium]
PICDAPAPARIADKAALFGDPTLVPTRHGERARLELAAAGEITRALLATGRLASVHVDVERSDAGARVLIAGRWAPGHDAADAEIVAVVHAVVGASAEVALALTPAAAASPVGAAPAGPPVLPLLLAAMGLGASGGVLLDRIARRRRRGRTRRSGRA